MPTCEPCDEIITLREEVASLETRCDIKVIHDVISQVKQDDNQSILGFHGVNNLLK